MDAKTLAALQKLSRRWKRKAAKERRDFYGEDAAFHLLYRCAKELDELIDQQAAITFQEAMNGCVLPRTD